ncbi:MAG: YicC/YloC family endoribonuclease [Pseudomonadota bacterium]
MIKSMTGFARAQAQHALGSLVFELRSVNHRYLEVSLRLPEEFRALDGAVRERIGARLARGKVDVGLKYQKAGSATAGFEVNDDLVAALGSAAGTIDARWPGDLPGITAGDVMRWPGVMTEVALDLAPLHQAALALMDDALDQLVAHREREGERLAGMLEERLAKVAHEVAGVRARSADVNQLLLGRMRERVAALDTSVDDGRLEQEVALLAQKADVAEELDRLDSHVTEGREALTRDEPVGRRLDFLMQEFNREANTLASKSHDAESTRASVELKVLIEQMREQVQNVE